VSASAERVAAALAGRYRIERELGAGGMAVVYLADDPRHGRPVAVKVMRSELAAALGPERFLREIRIAARLRHPNIVPLYDSGEADGLLYYVMPYIEGESLRDRLRRERQLPVDEALGIAREVADALAHAHEHELIHRDIKPENILLEGGHAVVADFGIARAVGSAATTQLTTATGLAIGTPAYMSPEQALGDAAVDARSDVYALGCVLYEMLAGEPPYTGPTPQAIVARQLAEPVRSLRIVREAVPDQLERAVMRALARVPADRFPSATAPGWEAAVRRRPDGRRGAVLPGLPALRVLLHHPGRAVSRPDRRSPRASGGSGDALRQVRALVAVRRRTAAPAVGGGSPGAEPARRGVEAVRWLGRRWYWIRMFWSQPASIPGARRPRS
jgi:serine/threonine-protein kinase